MHVAAMPKVQKFYFYRATRMHNADYAWQDVRPSVSLSSVYPSHAGIVYSFFSQSDSPTILVIPHQTG